MKDAIISLLKKIWGDPVLSKVIATGIIAALAGLSVLLLKVDLPAWVTVLLVGCGVGTWLIVQRRMKAEILTLQVGNQQLREEVGKLKAAAEEQLEFLHGVYWKMRLIPPSEEDELGIGTSDWDGPFCPTCKDVNHQSVRLRNLGKTVNQGEYAFYCDVHRIQFYAPRMRRRP